MPSELAVTISRRQSACGAVTVFQKNGQVQAGGLRRYHEDVDWSITKSAASSPPGEVTAQVAKLRRAHVVFCDTVPPENPPLDSPCDF